MRRDGIEPPTRGSSGPCSTDWATAAFYFLGEWWGSNPWPKEPQSSTLPTELQSPYLCLRRNRTSIPKCYTIVSFISSLLWYDITRALVTVTLLSPIYALNRHVVGMVGFEPTKPKRSIYSAVQLSNVAASPLFRMVGRTRTDEKPPHPKWGVLPTELLPYL